MKKIILLCSSFMIMSLFSVKGNNITNPNLNKHTNSNRYYNHSQTLSFNERGISFFVFTNGEFDFNTHPRHRYDRRRQINTTYGAPRTQSRRYYGDYGVRIEHDHLGRVRRIGNVFINYDRHGRIKRAGSIYMRYDNRLISRIGGMRIHYNCYGRIIDTDGCINHNNCRPNTCYSNQNYDYGDGYRDDYRDDWHYGNDDDLYYKNKEKSPQKRGKQ